MDLGVEIQQSSLQTEWNINTLKCPLCDCEPLIKDYSRHICNECEKRQVACSFCYDIFSNENLPNHEFACGADFITCAMCEFDLQRKEFKEHIKNCDVLSKTDYEKLIALTPKKDLQVLMERVIIQDKLINHLVHKVESLESNSENLQQVIRENKNGLEVGQKESKILPIAEKRSLEGNRVNMDVIFEYLKQTHACMAKFSCLYIDNAKFPDGLKLNPNMMLNSIIKQFYFPSEKVEGKKPIIAFQPIYVKVNLFSAKTKLHIDLKLKDKQVKGVYEYYHTKEGLNIQFGVENLPRSIWEAPKSLVNRMMLLLLDPVNQNNVLYLEKLVGNASLNMNYMMFSYFTLKNEIINHIHNKGYNTLDIILFPFEQFDN